MFDQTQVGAEAETLNADLKRSAMATQQMLKQKLQTARPLDGLLHLFDLTLRQSLPPQADRSGVTQTMEKELDLIQRKTYVARKTNEKYSVKSVCGVSSLAGNALSWSQYP